MNLNKKDINSSDFLSLALYAFGGLGLEVLLAFMIEPLVYGKSINDFTTFESILHWIITCIMWGIVAAILISLSREKYKFNIFEERNKIGKVNWLIALMILGICIIISNWNWNGFKVLKELEHNGWLKFIFQYIYYLFEIILVMLIIVFGQKAGEMQFKNDKIPWGGILLGLTWGLVHMFTKGDLMIGLTACLAGILYGVTYLTLKKNIYITYLLVLLMFIL